MIIFNLNACTADNSECQDKNGPMMKTTKAIHLYCELFRNFILILSYSSQFCLNLPFGWYEKKIIFYEFKGDAPTM